MTWGKDGRRDEALLDGGGRFSDRTESRMEVTPVGFELLVRGSKNTEGENLHMGLTATWTNSS